jgi:hypothetical protein
MLGFSRWVLARRTLAVEAFSSITPSAGTGAVAVDLTPVPSPKRRGESWPGQPPYTLSDTAKKCRQDSRLAVLLSMMERGQG